MNEKQKDLVRDWAKSILVPAVSDLSRDTTFYGCEGCAQLLSVPIWIDGKPYCKGCSNQCCDGSASK